MSRYYIANDCKFIGADGKEVDSIKDAKRFAYNDGQSYVNKNMNGAKSWRLQRAFHNNKKYVLTTATCFVGCNSPVTNDYTLAMEFKSSADATNYIKKHPALKKYMPNPVIIVDNFESTETPAIKTFTKEQLKTIGVEEKPVATPRVKISADVKASVAKASGEICAICGKPMSNWDKTLDHITPLSRGGSNKNTNLRYVHKKCNHFKNDLLDKEMFKMSADIEAKRMYEDPHGENSQMIIRALTRGILADYKQKGFLQDFKLLEGETIWENTV